MGEPDKQNLKIQAKLGSGKTVVGIDIGTGAVNIAQVAKYKGRNTLIRTAVSDINIKDYPTRDEAILAALREGLSGFNTKKAKVVCVVSSPHTCVRKIAAPRMPKDELRQAVVLEAKQFLPFSMDEAIFDFYVRDEGLGKKAEKLNVIVAAVPRETILTLMSYFRPGFSGLLPGHKRADKKGRKPSGIKVSAFVPLALALENIVKKSGYKKDEAVAAIEMGAEITELNVFSNSRLQFSRKIPFAGKDITKSLTGALITEKGRVQLTLEEAEEIKREYGIPGIEDNQMVKGKIMTNQILSLIRAKTEQLVHEIERSFDFYRESIRGQKINRIVLYGGGAQLKGLPDCLRKELGVEVRLGDPLEGVELLCDEVVENTQEAHRLVLAAGAALSDLQGINLCPAEAKERTQRSFVQGAFAVIAFCVVAVLCFSFFGVLAEVAENEKKAGKAEARFQELAPGLEKLKAGYLLARVTAGGFYWEEVLKELGRLVPPNMYLKEIRYENDVMVLKGVVTRRDKTDGPSLSQFMVALEQGLLKDVQLVNLMRSEENTSAAEFEIICKVGGQ
ncbi:MAG: type IV pilus assembly protein PilM [Candidatus Omnitrophica bacterium]|nr:type IV pilus assembly protein PilM [Candidatus Omnitrophota bacterium]